jgi:hypothetical protein
MLWWEADAPAMDHGQPLSISMLLNLSNHSANYCNNVSEEQHINSEHSHISCHHQLPAWARQLMEDHGVLHDPTHVWQITKDNSGG